MTLVLKTDRLILRPQIASDIDAIEAGPADFEVARFLTVVPFPYTRKDAEDWVARLTPPTAERAIFSIELPDIGMLGTITLFDELGYWLAQAYWGHGYMTEAARAVLAWHFDNTVAGDVLSGAHKGNDRSLAVQRKLGFVEIGEMTRYVRSLDHDVVHVETTLTRVAFTAARGARL
jgi:RimJ/RimL family protein N-acetyltransferase